ncbi:glycosyl transferase family 1 [Bifidobacterium sp. UTCIF-3]|nr:glycosyl transferase family 1 [Bifidobacterium sp. UTCIF-1]TPF80848.1 glycosyl transferase family 1 [Bifidobacterium sp. UTCIF-24]TPF82713.1 glycosyl transferase family 1 [Bifidobacterium sp. UTCIF-3]TPF84513.1 glycosyl transferase family 1 [Bifidobacterium sp. UTCIF-36]TPF90926.1 glycosyl transferase family 1 [Bifidobacterium sp. UTBIF-56]
METMGGGVRKHVLQLIDGLDSNQFELYLIYGPRYDHVFASCMNELKAQQKVHLIYMPELGRALNLKKDIAAIHKTTEIIRHIKPDIVHCHSSKAGIIGRVAAKICGVHKVFYTPHAYAFDSPEFSVAKKELFTMAERWASRCATTCTFNVSNGEYRNALKHHIDRPAKFNVIYNGVPDLPLRSRSEARTELGLDGVVPEDALIVGCAAWLDARKDPMTFMRIAERILANRLEIHFVYIGDGDLHDQVIAFIKQHHLENNIHVLGYRDDACQLVTAFNVYLLASLYEGMPYSLIEALQAGVPIAATRTTGNDEVVIPGVNGELFEVGDVDGGTRVVSQLLAASPHAAQVRQTYTDRFTEQEMLDRITQWYVRKYQ